MKRREFIMFTGAGAATTTLLSACGHPENKLIPVFIPDDEYVPGLDYWKATSCRMCSAGCGVIVRTREHKANKIEGNPLHPVNRGALCARGQAGLQVHYNPDRIRGPKKRMGERGSGQFQDISWEEAIKTLADKLREIKSQPESGSVLLAAHNSRDVTGLVGEHLLASVGSLKLAVDQYAGQQVEAASYRDSYGAQSLPVFDVGGARYLLSFGARFLETWHSPVMYSLGYAQFRQGARGGRGRFVQVEPRMSMTAANADEWLPAAPGTEGLVALRIAQGIIAESLVANAVTPSFLQQPLDDFDPDKTSAQTGIPAERIRKVAREFARARGLAIGGGTALAVTEATFSMRAINFLNSLVGNINKPGGVLLPAEPEFDPFSKLRRSTGVKWLSLPEQLASGTAPSAILFHRTNPLFTAPWLAETIKAAPFIASFSSFMDETTIVADLLLPDNRHFGRWGLGGRVAIGTSEPGSAGRAAVQQRQGLPRSSDSEGPDREPAGAGLVSAVTLSRPVLSTEYDTRQTADVLIAVGKAVGEEMERSLPFGSAEEIVKAAAAELQKLPGQGPESGAPLEPAAGSEQGNAASDFLNKFLEAGVWTARTAAPGKPNQPANGAAQKQPTGGWTAYPPPGALGEIMGFNAGSA